MTIEDQIKDEKLQYDINREAAKISALLSGKLDKYEYLTGEEILASNQQQIIQQAKFNYSPLGKATEKQRKMKLLGSTESKITKDKNGEKVPHLKIVELVLVHCNLVNNDYQQDSRILYTFVPNKTFGSLLEMSPTNQVFFKNL